MAGFTKDKLQDCNCIGIMDKVKITGSLRREINNLERNIKMFDMPEEALIKFKNETIPEYTDLIKRIQNTPDC